MSCTLGKRTAKWSWAVQTGRMNLLQFSKTKTVLRNCCSTLLTLEWKHSLLPSVLGLSWAVSVCSWDNSSGLKSKEVGESWTELGQWYFSIPMLVNCKRNDYSNLLFAALPLLGIASPRVSFAPLRQDCCTDRCLKAVFISLASSSCHHGLYFNNVNRGRSFNPTALCIITSVLQSTSLVDFFSPLLTSLNTTTPP